MSTPDPPQRPPGVTPHAILRLIRVPPEAHGMRLDRFLSLQLRATSRTRAQAIIEASAFSWHGRPLRASERLRGEQQIALWRPPLKESPPPREIRVLHEDPHLLVVDKPPLMTVHPTARHHKFTVIKVLEEQRPSEFLSLIHRLDRETSGVLLLGRSKEADRAFKMQLERRAMESILAAERGDPVPRSSDKTYLAITWGIPESGLVTEPLIADPSPLRVKMRIAPRGMGLASRTHIEVLSEASGYALVRCHLHTGRQHQIRVHLAHLGTPIVGDKLYGPDETLLARGADGCLSEDDLLDLELPRHALHAAEYRVWHPFLNEPIEVKAPFPADLAQFFRDKGGVLPDCIQNLDSEAPRA